MPVSDRYYRYNHSLKGIRRRERHWRTEKYRVGQERFYANHNGESAYRKNRYHGIQDGAGCHMCIADFYPAYCFLQALVSAKVVEV